MTFKIGGEAGQGVESSGAGFAKALSRGGLYVFGLQDYRSRIRGGHNFFQIRVSERNIYSHTEPVHLLLALTSEAIETHKDELVQGGGIIFDESLKVNTKELEDKGIKLFKAPLVKIAIEEGGNRVMMNTAALGAAAGLVKYDFKYMASVIEDNFKRKGSKIVTANLKVAKAAYDFTLENYAANFNWELRAVKAPQRMVISGNHAFCLGAVAVGCRFISGYPMTPATSILEWMSAHAKQLNIVTKHTEDEIAAICMAIGAAHVGARAMTATSGGGFSLMTEALGLAGMTETPLVIVEAQRGGPSTGLPTRTEQADLQFVLHASQGEFPRIVLAPGTQEQCFEAGVRAFNLAEKYQCPVIILTDEFLATSLRAIDPNYFDLAKAKIDRGEILSEEDLTKLKDYARYRFTASGISPRALPGNPNAVYSTTGDEHTEKGHITEDQEIRTKMMEKRMRKLERARQEMNEPELYGPEEAELTLIGWGSSYGPIREAVDALNEKGISANFMHIMDIWPFPEEKVAELLERTKLTVAVESNYTGQLADLIRERTGHKVNKKILKYDGRPLSPDYILKKLKEEVKYV